MDAPIDFSLVLPTRERVKLLDGLLESLAVTTANPERLEVIISADDDDRETLAYIETHRQAFSFVQWIVGPRRQNFTIHYYNKPAQESRGRYVMAMNDDVRFLTPCWDELSLPVLDEYKARFTSGFLMGKCGDGLGERYPCFPILSREALNIVGWVFHPEFTAWGADIHLHRIYSALDRVVDLPFEVSHLCHHTQTRSRDHINERMARLSKYNYDSAVGETRRIRDILRNTYGESC